MEGELSTKKLESVLMQAMFAAKNVRAQEGRLLQFDLQLVTEKTVRLEELTTGLVKTLHLGLEAGARYLTSCLEIAAENGARLALSPGFAAMPHEQLDDALFDVQLPARATTQAEAFTSIETAFYAVKLAREHFLGSCIGHLLTVAPPEAAAAGPAQDSGTIRRAYNLIRIGRVWSLVELAVKHVDHAVVVISRFVDPDEVARLAEFTEKHGII